MKKLILALALTSALFSCKKETTTPNNSGNNTTDTTKTSNQKLTSGYGPNITDVEGNSYKTVYIGTQTWMAENLKVSKYNDGTTIPNVTDNIQWAQLSLWSTGAWAYCNNDAANNAKYGKLYNWHVVGSSSKNVCPTGWHVPGDDEWTVLTDYLGGVNVAGGKLKEVGTSSWNSPNREATNTSLFSALPGGSRRYNGDNGAIGISGSWWSSDDCTVQGSPSIAWYRNISFENGSADRFYNIKEGGFSVRCIKD